jgi:hypothetical protein
MYRRDTILRTGFGINIDPYIGNLADSFDVDIDKTAELASKVGIKDKDMPTINFHGKTGLVNEDGTLLYGVYLGGSEQKTVGNLPPADVHIFFGSILKPTKDSFRSEAVRDKLNHAVSWILDRTLCHELSHHNDGQLSLVEWGWTKSKALIEARGDDDIRIARILESTTKEMADTDSFSLRSSSLARSLGIGAVASNTALYKIASSFREYLARPGEYRARQAEETFSHLYPICKVELKDVKR